MAKQPRCSAARRRQWQDPVYRARMAEERKRRWDDPVRRAAMTAKRIASRTANKTRRRTENLAAAREKRRTAGWLDRVRGKCVYCGAEARTTDHVIPRGRIGWGEPDNVVPCCGKCNRSKGSRTPLEWLSSGLYKS